MTGDIWARNGGVYLGFGADQTEGDPPPLDEPLFYVGDRHIVSIGPNGSGKTRRLLLPNLVQLTGWSMLVVDPKGELARMTAEHRLKAGNDVIFLNPFNLFGLKSDGFNPVAALNRGTDDQVNDDFPDDALGLAEAMIRVEGRDPHWGQAAQELIAGMIMYVRLVERVSGSASLADVRALLGKASAEFRSEIFAMLIAAEVHDCPELAAKVGRFASLSPDNNEMNSVLSTALAQTRWLDSRPIKNDLKSRPSQKGSDQKPAKDGPKRDLFDGDLAEAFDFSVMKKRPVTVYLILPARRLATHSTWLRLMITSIIQPLMKDVTRGNVPVLLMLDEYFALAEGGFPIIEKNMAMFRGYGIKLWTVLQDLSQAAQLYGNHWESFVANAGVLHSFAPQDLMTADYLSKRTGQTGRNIMNWSQASRAGQHIAEGNITLSQTPMPLMLPQDLRNMDDGFFVMFSHKAKGTIPGYAPYPTQLRGLENITALDPTTEPAR